MEQLVTTLRNDIEQLPVVCRVLNWKRTRSVDWFGCPQFPITLGKSFSDDDEVLQTVLILILRKVFMMLSLCPSRCESSPGLFVVEPLFYNQVAANPHLEPFDECHKLLTSAPVSAI